MTGTGIRVADSFEGNKDAAPLLHLKYSGVSANTGPVVDAGGNQTVTLPDSLTLHASVMDDGLPGSLGVPVVGWSYVTARAS